MIYFVVNDVAFTNQAEAKKVADASGVQTVQVVPAMNEVAAVEIAQSLRNGKLVRARPRMPN